jgi:hypothetical protein
METPLPERQDRKAGADLPEPFPGMTEFDARLMAESYFADYRGCAA